MIICPTCGQEEYYGTLFCRECGTPLFESGNTTQNLPTTAPETQILQDPSLVAREPVAGVILQLPQGETLTLRGTGEWTLGRRSPNSAADIDLTPYQAYEHGVSRMHAALRITTEGAFVIDLNSANGTFLNGLKLRPHTPYPLHHGDRLLLGKLALKVSLESQPRR